MEWQPIETAPKDGTPILLYGRIEWEDYGDDSDEACVVVGFYQERSHRQQADNWCLINANPYIDYCHATHWMPLPDPPNGKDE